MSRSNSIICGVCQCTLDSGDCIHVYGSGTTDDPYRFESVISEASGNLIECGPNGLGAFLLPIYLDPPAVHLYSTIEQVIAFDTVQGLQFNESRYNTDNMTDDSDLGIIKFQTPGLYLVTFNARWKKTNDSAATGDMAAFLMRNGAQYLVLDSFPVPGGDSFAKHSISMLYPFEAGDFCSALLKQDVVDGDDEPMNLTATVHRMSPIFCAMHMRPLEGMNVLGVPASAPADSEDSVDLEGGQWWETPDHASLDITGDIDIRVAATIDDWTPATTVHRLVSKWISASSSKSYLFQLLPNSNPALDGALSLAWSTTGNDSPSETSDAVPVVFDGGTLGLRVTFDVDDGASDHVVRFYVKATTPSSALVNCESNTGWTQLGSDMRLAVETVTSIFSGSLALAVGADPGGGNADFPGSIHAVVVKDGIQGTTVANPDFYRNTSPFTDASGRTWTKNS